MTDVIEARDFYVNPANGEMSVIQLDRVGEVDANQVLRIVGIDSSPIFKGGIKVGDSDINYCFDVAHTNFLNIENKSNLRISIGNCIVTGIKRNFPDISFDFTIIRNVHDPEEIINFETYHFGFKSLANHI
ncbi:MAG: hypothetical protein K2X26_06280 [Chitinophagaceae bacterium]|nr:hypothetical protein [Chitinophagaceae bacterium]